MKTVALLLPALLFGCAMDSADPTDDQFTDDEVTSTTQQAVDGCFLQTTPPAYDALWSLTASRTGVVSNYGVGPCDAYVLGVRNSSSVTVSAKPQLVENPDINKAAAECIGTQLTVTKYRKQASTWSYEGVETVNGVYTTSGCRQPKVTWYTDDAEVRVAIKTSRTTCSGIYCGTQRGLAMNVSASVYVPPGPPN